MSQPTAPNSSDRRPLPPPAEATQNRHRWLIMVAVGVGSLLGSIDTNVVAIALPTLRHQFGVDVAQAEWVVTLYLLTGCCFLLPFGRLGDMRGQKPIYVWGFFLFVLSSALCGLAPSIGLLILSRALQGMGAAMLFSSAPAILTTNFPAAQRGRVLGMQIVMVYLGATIGPSLGGWLTDHFSWRAVFYINVPIGVVACYLSARFIPHHQPAKTGESFDFAGAAQFMAIFSLLLLALNQGHEHGWNSPYILGMFAAALVLLASFIWTEGRTAAPLLDLSMFRVAPFTLSAASAVCNYVAVFTNAFLMPFYLIQGRGLSSSHTGLLMTIQPAIMVLSAPTSGALSDKIGTRWLSVIGMATLAVAMFLLGRAGPATSLAYIGTSIGLVGLGIGVFIAPNNSTLMGSAPRNRQGIAAGVLATSRYAGMILGVGISGAIFTTFLHGQAADSFYTGIQISFLVASGVSVLGCLMSAARSR